MKDYLKLLAGCIGVGFTVGAGSEFGVHLVRKIANHRQRKRQEKDKSRGPHEIFTEEGEG